MLVLSVRKLVFQPPNAPKPNFQKGGICFEQNLSAQKGVGARAFKIRLGSFQCESLFLSYQKPPGLTPQKGCICFEQNFSAQQGVGAGACENMCWCFRLGTWLFNPQWSPSLTSKRGACVSNRTFRPKRGWVQEHSKTGVGASDAKVCF